MCIYDGDWRRVVVSTKPSFVVLVVRSRGLRNGFRGVSCDGTLVKKEVFLEGLPRSCPHRQKSVHLVETAAKVAAEGAAGFVALHFLFRRNTLQVQM